VVATAVVFYRLGDRPLWWWDESFYANAARNAIEGGYWLIPHLAGFDTIHASPFLEKPPLAIWLEALSIGVFGPTEFAVRVPSAAAAVTTTVLVFLLGREIRGRGAGLAAAAAFLSTPAVLVGTNAARFGVTDMLHTFFGSLLVALVWLHATGRRDVSPALAGGVAAALLLTKGFAAGVFFLAFVPLLLRHRERFPRRFVGVAAAVTTVAVGWWVAAVYAVAGDYFVEEIFVEPVWHRIVGTDTVPAGRRTLVPIFEYPYLTRLQSAFRPWWFLFLAGGVVAAVTGHRSSTESGGMDPRFLLWWTAAVLGPFLFFGTKSWYIVPTFVPAALTVGWLVATALDRATGVGSTGERAGRPGAAVGLLVGTVLAAIAGPDGLLYELSGGSGVTVTPTIPPDSTVLVAVGALCVGAWLVTADRFGRELSLPGGSSLDAAAVAHTLTAGVVLALVVGVLVGAPSVYAAGNADEPTDTEFHRLGATTADVVPADARVYVQPNAAARWFYAGYDFYADRPMREVPVERLRTDPAVRYALMTTQGVPIVSDRDPSVIAESSQLDLVLVELGPPAES
jgi:4-amino-4-deoxy-L-arabinose transferase-like glycosyltransferase